MKSANSPRFAWMAALINMALLFLTLFSSGCMSVRLFNSNNDFSEKNQQHTYFNDTPVKAEYLGKQDGAYVYRAIDSINQEVFFRLPSQKGKDVTVSLGSSKGATIADGSATFYFLDDEEQPIEIDNISTYPRNIFVRQDLTHKSSCKAGICQNFTYQYSCMDGSFSNPLSEDNTYGLSTHDSFVLGLRRIGYVATVPFDIATWGVAAPFGVILLPAAYLMVPKYNP